MTYIKNNKTLVFIIAILLLSNIALLWFLVSEDKQPPKENPREFMIRTLKSEVGFSDEQISQYEQLSDKHKENMKSLFDGIRLAKDSLYKLLLQDAVPDSVTHHYLQIIGEKQQNIDQKIYAHFYSLRQLCTAEQKPKYDSAVQRIIRKMINPHKNKNEEKK